VLTSRENQRKWHHWKAKLYKFAPSDWCLKPEGQEIFKAKGLSGSEDKSAVLIEQYAGNPLALKIVATAIQDVFDGNVAEFLTQNKTVFGDIRDILISNLIACQI